jgi:hypothetical protein
MTSKQDSPRQPNMPGRQAMLRLILIVAFLCASSLNSIQASDPFSRQQLDFFERSIRPLLIKHCYKCHSNQVDPLEGSLRVDDRTLLLAGGDRGPAVVPGRPTESLLWNAVQYSNEDLQMPPAGKLADNDLQAIQKWIQLGLPMPATAEIGEGAEEKPPAGETDHWSFQLLEDISLPSLRRTDWVLTRIDNFVARRHRLEKLGPSPPATRRELIRRLSFDLLGLPPSLQQVASFEADTAPNAWGRLVDQLIASPAYGERWGRYWLDLARYTDTTASWLNTTGQSHLYRDWVVQALNRDLPYDQFVRLQLAADKIAGTDPQNMAALGFLGLSPTYWKELQLSKEVIREIVAEEWEERIDAFGRTFLGLSIACARCHDHKFDPITTRDYYALAGVFASTRLTDRSLLPAEQAAVVEAAHRRSGKMTYEIAELKKQQKLKGQEEDPAVVQKLAALESELELLKKETPFFDYPLAHGVDDASLYVLADGPNRTRLEYREGEARDLPVFLRGNPASLGDVVPRRFLEVFAGEDPAPFLDGSGRGGLAASLLTDSPSLLARVVVNRVWMHHFGAGLVATPSDFGSQGQRPTHPQLLDDLADRLIQHGWSMKWLHREILMSATYQQSSAYHPANESRDPDNKFLWRMNRRRLDIEAWRDAMLSAGGILDLQMAGAAESLAEAGNRRRTIYGRVARRELDPVLQMYGFPPPTSHSPKREMTINAMQQLYVLNGDFIRQRAADLVRRLQPVKDEFSGQIVSRAFELLYHRPAEKEEIELTRQYFIEAPMAAEESGFGRWEQLFQVLLAGNEFAFVD